MKRVLVAAVLGFACGVSMAWIIGVLILHLHWEMTLLLVEVLAVVGAAGAALAEYLRRRSQ